MSGSGAHILGLTAPVQTGKIQLTPVFEELGWRFADLNDAIYDARICGTTEHDYVQGILPGGIDDEGVETAIYYRDVTADLHHHLVERNLERVLAFALRAIDEARGGRVVLSWEYLARVPQLSLDHVLVFHSDRKVWYERMQARARELSEGGWSPDDAWLDRLVEALGIVPESILAGAQHVFGSDRITLVDVSPSDWGAAHLRSTLAQWL